MALSRAQIEAASKAKIAAGVVKVKAFGGECCLRLMSVGDRDSLELKLVEHGGKVIPDFRSEMLSRTLCDEAGELLYPGEDGVASLRKLSADEMHAVYMAAMKHNALTEDEVQKIAGE